MIRRWMRRRKRWKEMDEKDEEKNKKMEGGEWE